MAPGRALIVSKRRNAVTASRRVWRQFSWQQPPGNVLTSDVLACLVSSRLPGALRSQLTKRSAKRGEK
jgi:hypothetical protein